MIEPIANILLVDDDYKSLTAMEALLSGPGRKIVTASSGTDALRRLLQEEFALILLDVRMPDMDGFETAAMIRQNERFRYTPIIFLSAVDTLDEDVIRGVSSGAVDYLFKPVMPDVLKTKVSVFVDLFRMNERLKQQAVKEAQALLAAVVESSQDAIISKNLEGVILSWNAGAERLFGYGAEEAIGKSIMIIVPPEKQEEDTRNLERIRRGERIEPFETLRRAKDGRLIDVSLTISPIFDGAGRIIGASKVARDITERKRAEERFRAAVEASPNAMIMVGKNGKIVFVNDQGEKLFGYAREDLVGHMIERLVPERFRGKHADYRNSFFSDPKSRPMGAGRDLYGLRKDGSEVPIEIGLNPIETGEGKFVLASIIDITQRKRMEAELIELNAELEKRVVERTTELVRSVEQREKLQQQLSQAQKMESIGTLAGGIAHDFNNILTIILGYSSALKDNPGDPDKVGAGLDIIRETGVRGAVLVQQLLTLARSGNLSFQPTDINELLHQFSKILAETFPKTIAVSVETASDLPPILADPNRLHQALLNLCVNARDAMNGSGKLVLRDEIVSGGDLRKRFPDAKDESYACVSISDTGAGIHETVRDRIFDPFFTTKGPGEGTGLGLTAVYGIVREHDGFVEVESEPGRGATFRLHLPLRPVNGKGVVEPYAAEAHEAEAVRENGTVLLVDDEERQLELIQGFLEKKGYRVLLARDGIEAVETHRRHKDEIAAIVLDLGLPKLSGWEAFLKMKQEEPQIKTIFTSGYIKPEMRLEMIREGVVAIVHKPYLPDDLLAKVGAAIRRPAARQKNAEL
jgi:PAS domain S-box-containing protein